MRLDPLLYDLVAEHHRVLREGAKRPRRAGAFVGHDA